MLMDQTVVQVARWQANMATTTPRPCQPPSTSWVSHAGKPCCSISLLNLHANVVCYMFT